VAIDLSSKLVDDPPRRGSPSAVADREGLAKNLLANWPGADVIVQMRLALDTSGLLVAHDRRGPNARKAGRV